MHAAWVSLAAALLGCSDAPAYLPYGAWESDRELTLATFASDPALSAAHRAVLEDETLFGRNVQVFAARGAAVWFEGGCGEFWPYDYDVVEAAPGSLRYRTGEPGEERSIEWDDRFMYLPLADGRAREVFRRVPLEQALEQHPCLATALGSGRVAADAQRSR